MNAPDSWLFAVADNSRYSTRSRLLLVGLSFAIRILTFLLYLAISYACGRRRQHGAGTGDQEAGMSDAALLKFLYEQADTQTAMDCAVCLGQVEAGEKVRRFPNCAHLFHADCVDAGLRAHSTCSMCRAAVTSPKEDDTTPPAAATATAQALPPDMAAGSRALGRVI